MPWRPGCSAMLSPSAALSRLRGLVRRGHGARGGGRLRLLPRGCDAAESCRSGSRHQRRLRAPRSETLDGVERSPSAAASDWRRVVGAYAFVVGCRGGPGRATYGGRRPCRLYEVTVRVLTSTRRSMRLAAVRADRAARGADACPTTEERGGARAARAGRVVRLLLRGGPDRLRAAPSPRRAGDRLPGGRARA